MDAASWAQREQRYAKKFVAGKKYIPGLFEALDLPLEIDQIALLVFGSSQGRTDIGGGKILMIGDFMQEIRNEISCRRVENAAPRTVPALAYAAVRGEILEGFSAVIRHVDRAYTRRATSDTFLIASSI